MATAKNLVYVLPSEADKYVIEDNVMHLTWDIIAWMVSVFPEWKLTRMRYEWEKLIEKSRGKSMFLELTYTPTREGLVFPYMKFYLYPVHNWVVCFVDYIECANYIKVVIRMLKIETKQKRKRKR